MWRLSLPLMAGVYARHRRQLDHRPLRLARSAAQSRCSLRQADFHRAHGDAGSGRRRGLHALFRQLWTRERHFEFATGVADSVSRVAALGLLAASVHDRTRLAGHRSVADLGGGRFTQPIESRLCRSISPSSPSRSSSGPRRPFTHAPSMPPETLGCPWSPAPSSRLSSFPIYGLGSITWCGEPSGWRSPPTSASSAGRSPSPFCSTSAAWCLSPASTMLRWAAVCWAPLPVAPPRGSSLGFLPASSTSLPATAALHHARSIADSRNPHRRHRGLDGRRDVGPRQSRLGAAQRRHAPPAARLKSAASDSASFAPTAPALQLIRKQCARTKHKRSPSMRKRSCSMRNLRLLRTAEGYEL